jgi:hypothetical protein
VRRRAPNFAVLFAADAQIHQDREWIVSPRTAYVLWDSAEALYGRGVHELEALGDSAISPPDDDLSWHVWSRYPPLTWGQDSLWRRYAVAAFRDLSRDLSRGVWPMPENAAEEMALWLIIDDAEDRVEFVSGEISDFPAHPDDHTWEECRDALFHDHDFLLLFDPVTERAGDPEDPMHAIVPDIADYRPAAWFDPFWGGERRRPGEMTYRDARAL